MKRWMRFCLLCIGLGLLLLLCWLIPHIQQQGQEPHDNKVYAFDSSKVQNFSWTYNGEQVSFYKDGDFWVYAQDEAAEIDQEEVNRRLELLAQLEAERVFEGDDDELSEYGFEAAELIISVKLNEAPCMYYVGNLNTTNNQYYLSVNMDKVIYMINENLVDIFANSVMKSDFDS